MALNVATVDKQRVLSAEKGFDLRQQWNIAHGVFLLVNKENSEANPPDNPRLDCACRLP
jgi:hypothetical protein